MAVQSEKERKGRRRVALYLAIALACLLLVGTFGLYQFAFRAKGPIQEVKSHRVPRTGETIEEIIEPYLRSKGQEIATEGFKPSWGAEETSPGVWLVSYVYEVGREARWISWEVDTRRGRVKPRDGMARELWEGKQAL